MAANPGTGTPRSLVAVFRPCPEVLSGFPGTISRRSVTSLKRRLDFRSSPLGQFPALSAATGVDDQQIENRGKQRQDRQGCTGQPMEEELQAGEASAEVSESHCDQQQRNSQAHKAEHTATAIGGKHVRTLPAGGQNGQWFAAAVHGGSVTAWRMNHSGISSKRSNRRAN